MLPEIRPVQLTAAATALIECYERAGITFEMDFVAVPATSWPTWRELQPMLASNPKTEDLAAVIRSWVRAAREA